MVKLILDEIFGAERFRGWLVWSIGSGAKGRQQWSNQHNDIFCYSKGETFTFNHEDPDLREPYAELSTSMHFNKVDEAGRRRIAVNLRLAPPEAVAALPIDHFDGLDTFDDLPRDHRCVGDLWF